MESIKNVKYERVYVETPLDTDADGKRDLIACYILLPQNASARNPVPAVFIANPYMMECNEDLYTLHNVDMELPVQEAHNFTPEDLLFKPERLPEITPRKPAGAAFSSPVDASLFDVVLKNNNPFYQTLPSRGYAVVFCGGLGTKGSEGFISTGSRNEVLAFKSVIDWLCGRVNAFTDLTSSISVEASWCNKKVGMTGKSYVGTTCWGVASTGVDGLITIIPEAGISNWYDYYRQNGLCSPALDWQGDDIDLLSDYCMSRRLDEKDWADISDAYARYSEFMRVDNDRANGTYNRFWDERNYKKHSSKMRASALIVHGINDWNVKMNQCAPMWVELNARGIPCRMLLHQGEHIRINTLEDIDFNNIFYDWLDYWLLDKDNGIMDRLVGACVESNLDPKEWLLSECWPPKDSKKKTYCAAKNALLIEGDSPEEGKLNFTDDLSLSPYDREADNQGEWLQALCGTTNEWSARLFTKSFEQVTRLSGTPRVSFDAVLDCE
ncbi:MAG: hypothetical protein GX975_02535, partial [Clostridiales bacterium]|nr:hypothetical protein [Clostridiales bacterium]